MNVDMDSAGELATAGLVAREIEEGQRGAGAVKDAHPSSCANCNAALAGAFCHQCGQRAHVHRSLLHMGEELMHGILHFDGKALRTLPMLVAKPGELTRRYVDGQRTRYVSPLALFLFMIFLMFFTASYTTRNDLNLQGTPKEVKTAVTRMEKQLAKSRLEVGRAEARLADVATRGGDASAISAQLEQAREGVTELETALATLKDVPLTVLPPGSTEKPQGRSISVTTGIAPVDGAIRTALKNPELAVYKLKNTASKFSFLLVPITLPFLWLMFFWKRGITMYDHAVFSLYSLSFMALMFSALMALSAVGLSSLVEWVPFVAAPLHMYLQLKGTYRLGVGGAVARTIALTIVAGTVCLLYLLLIVALTVS